MLGDTSIDLQTSVRLSLLSSFFILYGCVSTAMRFIIKPPKSLENIKEYHDYFGQHVSLVHSVVAAFIAIGVYLHESGIHYNSESNYLHDFVMAHSMGYFFYDMVYAEIFAVHDTAMRLHHISVILGGGILFLSKVGGSVGVFCVMLTEISNPFQQVRAIYKTRREEDTAIFRYSERLFAVIFSFNRAIVGTILVYNIWTSIIGIHIKLCVSAIYAIGIFWVYVIISLLLKRLRENKVQINQPFKIVVDLINWFKRRTKMLIAAIFVWSFATPIVLTQVLQLPPHELVVSGFVIV